MKKRMLLSAYSAFTASLLFAAMPDGYVAIDKAGITATQSTEEGGLTGKNAIDGNRDSWSGWNDGLLSFINNGVREHTTDNSQVAQGDNYWVFDMQADIDLWGLAIQWEGNDTDNSRAVKFNIEFYNEGNIPNDNNRNANKIIAIEGNADRLFENAFKDQNIKARYVVVRVLEANNPAWGVKLTEVDFYSSQATPDPETSVEKDATYSDGPWATKVVDVQPAFNYGGSESLWFDDKTDNQYGWGDNALGTNNEIALGQAYFTLDMRRDVNVSRLQLINELATIQKYQIDFMDAQGNVISSTPHETTATDNLTVEDIVLDNELKGVRYIKFNILKIKEPGWGGRFREISIFGRDNAMLEIERIALTNKVSTINYNAEGNWVGQATTPTIVAITKDGQGFPVTGGSITLTNGASKSGEGNYNAQNGEWTGSKQGVVPVDFTWADNTSGKIYNGSDYLEVAYANWSKQVNLARSYKTTAPINTVDNGYNLGNPIVEVTANTQGAANQLPRNLVDGDWMAWEITADEMAGDTKPQVTIDLGIELPVNEFDLHYNANGDGQGNGTYAQQSANYDVYASTNGQNWTKVYTEPSWSNFAFYIDRHTFPTTNARYLRFEFNSIKGDAEGGLTSINELTVTGPVTNEDGTLKDFPAGNRVLITTPEFDRSNPADRSLDNNFLVTSQGINPLNPTHLSYQATDIYGRDLLEGNGYKINLKLYAADGTTAATDGNLSKADKDVNYRNITWDTYVYTPGAIGQQVVKAEIVDAQGNPVTNSNITAEPLTIYTVSEHVNVNRFAYAYDNAKDYAPNWAEANQGDFTDADTNPAKQGDRDLNAYGTAPANASDGQYGSWYVIGYYGPSDAMGATYKYPANHTLKTPYELVMDYRGAEKNGQAEYFVKELDMIGLTWEGAFPKDYDVYILHGDEHGNVTDENAWEKAATFTSMRDMGIGQRETQRIYPANADGTPKTDANGHIIPWENVVAVKVVLRTTGTTWGFKLYESAIYGKLSKVVLPVTISQAYYGSADGDELATAGGTRFASFDLNVASRDIELLADEKASLKEAMASVSNLRLTITATDKETGNVVAINDDFLPETVEVNAGTTKKPVTATRQPSTEGKAIYTFTLPAITGDNADKAVEFDGIFVNNADPAYDYTVSVEAIENGNETESIRYNNSQTGIAAPTAAFTVNNITAEAIDGQSVTTSKKVLGTNDKGDEGRYTRFNEAVINGQYAQLMLHNKVLDTYNVTYRTIAGDNEEYVTEFKAGKGRGINTGYVPVKINRIALPEATAPVGDAAGQDAPQSIKNLEMTSLAADSITVSARNTVTYAYPTGSTTTTVTAADNTGKVALNGVTSQILEPSRQTSQSVILDNMYVALVNEMLKKNDSHLNYFYGFFGSNEYRDNKLGNDVFGGTLIPEDGVLKSKDGSADYVTYDYDAFDNNGAYTDANNFGWLGAEQRQLGIRLDDITDQKVAPTGTTFYILYDAEYPFVLDNPSFTLNINGNEIEAVKSETNAAPRRAAALAPSVENLQVFTKPVLVPYVVGENVVTTVNDINATTNNNGTVEYYDLSGRRVDARDITSGIYIVRQGGNARKVVINK